MVKVGSSHLWKGGKVMSATEQDFEPGAGTGQKSARSG